MRIYLDHAAGSPMRPEVLEAMLPYFTEFQGNPSSIHQDGQAARRALDQSRTQILTQLGAFSVKELIFTSGGTESCSLAILGAAFARQDHGRHILISAIEHPAVVEAAGFLEALFGFEIERIPVGPDGILDPNELEKRLRTDTILASVMLANNEIGTIQPIQELAQICRAHGTLFHTDACQAPGYTDIRVDHLEPDLMTLNAAKIGGPKGVGLLYVRQGTPLVPLQRGGGQEFRQRGGTENVAGIVGFAKAFELTLAHAETESVRLKKLRDQLWSELVKIPGLVLNGSADSRLPNNLNIHTPGISGESLVMRLDLEGLAASSGSACSSGKTEPSPVLLALGQDTQKATQSLRLTLGWNTTESDVDKAIEILRKILAQ